MSSLRGDRSNLDCRGAAANEPLVGADFRHLMKTLVTNQLAGQGERTDWLSRSLFCSSGPGTGQKVNASHQRRAIGTERPPCPALRPAGNRERSPTVRRRQGQVQPYFVI